MLSGTMVRVRHAKNRLMPMYLPTYDAQALTAADQLVTVFKESKGKTRSELNDLLLDLLAEGPNQLVHQGLAKLLEDRCEFEVASEFPPEAIREAVFRLAAKVRHSKEPFDREAIMTAAGEEMKLPVLDVERGLFADLKDEQRFLTFDDCTPEYLLRRYNVALAQALLIRCTNLEAVVKGETPVRFRQLFRALRFHKLIATIKPAGKDGYRIHVSGPLSLFSSTQKYGLQLALFLPSLMHCKSYELTATVRWGAERKEKQFTLSSEEGIESHTPDFGMFRPKELDVLANNFAKLDTPWELSMDPHPVPVGDTLWVPDFTLAHKASKRLVYVEVLGFWRQVDLSAHLARLRQHLPGKFVLAVGESQKADEEESQTTAKEVYIYKRTPSAAEVLRFAEAQSP